MQLERGKQNKKEKLTYLEKEMENTEERREDGSINYNDNENNNDRDNDISKIIR